MTYEKALDGPPFLLYTDMDKSLIGGNFMNIAVVTGASSGIGMEFVKRIAAEGGIDEMWLIARRADRLEKLASELSLPCRVLSLDLTERDSFKTYYDLLESEKPVIRTLVNAGGFGKFGHHTAVDVEVGLNMIDLNCKALMAMTELSLPFMEKGSVIYQMGSLSSFQPVPYLNTYAASKAFVLSYTRGLNRELKHSGIRVMAVCPGWVQTEFFDRAATSDADAVTYFNHIYTPEDVVHTAFKDMRRGRDVSVHGFPIKLQVLGVKLLPHKLVMNIWMRQQKHK